MPIGSVEIVFELTKEQYESLSNIDFYVMSPDFYNIPESERRIELLETIGQLDNLSIRYNNSIMPVIR
jgi:hypothetical protein